MALYPFEKLESELVWHSKIQKWVGKIRLMFSKWREKEGHLFGLRLLHSAWGNENIIRWNQKVWARVSAL